MIRKRAHGGLEPITLRGRGLFGLRGGAVERDLAPSFAAAQSHQGDPGGYTLQPPDEPATLLVTPECFREPHEYVMHDVFRVFAGADEPIRQPEYRPSVLQVESGEGVRAPGPCLSD